jgi:hypothetical protein
MNRLPLPGATHLPPNKFTTPIVESLDGYREAIDEAQGIGDYLTTLPIISTTVVTPGPVTDKWQQAEDKRDADDERRQRWRNRALSRQQVAIKTANGILLHNVDDILNQLHLRLVDVLLTAEPDLKALVAEDICTADQAIEHGLVEPWARLAQTTWPDYRTLRDSQEWVHLHIAPDTIWRSARPNEFDSEDPASLLWLRNLPELWPDWRNGGRSRPEYRIDGRTPRPEPWAKPHGPEFLLWAHQAGATHWIPDTRQFRELFAERRQQVSDDVDEPEEQDDDTRDNSEWFRGLPPPIMAQR